tara:strand:+ start:1351 stop:1563 length:213 start_codon:yes stop_codon:yes gene_type:complete
MEYIVFSLCVALIITGVGHQSIRYDGNKWFGYNSESFIDCFVAGVIITIKVFLFAALCTAFFWSAEKVFG